MIAQWDSSLSVLPVARVQSPAMAEYFKGFFPGWSHSAYPSWASMAENGSNSPQWVTFSMGHAGASRKSPNDAPWETLSLRLSRPISAPLLTVARSWRHEKKKKKKAQIIQLYLGFWSMITFKRSLWNLINHKAKVRDSQNFPQRGKPNHV